MLVAEYDDFVRLIIDAVEDAIGAAAGRPDAGEFTA
jgi:hypothetical protein